MKTTTGPAGGRRITLPPVPFFTCGADEIWGLTAGILKQFLDLVFPRKNDAVSRPGAEAADMVAGA